MKLYQLLQSFENEKIIPTVKKMLPKEQLQIEKF